jgi:uncharacterized damage-inducible protein DinB
MSTRPSSSRPVRRILWHLVLLLVLPASGTAQSPDGVRSELLRQFEWSMHRFIALAEAMPAEAYTWSPGEGVMEVGQVYMHVARYNFLYPVEFMGQPLPAGVDLDGMEAVREKEVVVRALEASRAYVREVVPGLSAEALGRETRLYGRDVPRWAVLVQLVTHMNEHLGQAIAYARMNDVVPPWSR